MDFSQLEHDAMEAVRKVVADAEAHEPAIEAAAMQALGAAGAPEEVVTALGALLTSLLNHFKGTSPPAPVTG